MTIYSMSRKIIILLLLSFVYPNITYSANLTNSTTDNNQEDEIDPSAFITVFALLAAGIGGPITIFLVLYQRRQHRLSAMMEVFKILNNSVHREARKNVYNGFKRYELGEKDTFKTPLYGDSAATVRADFDEIGSLIQNKLIPKDLFLKNYWNTVLICWKALESNISEHRVKRDYPHYMEHFQWLNDEAYSYWKDKRNETKEIRVYDSNDEQKDDKGLGSPLKF